MDGCIFSGYRFYIGCRDDDQLLLPFLIQIVASKYFEIAMLAIILASSLELCFDDATIQAGSTKAWAMHAMDIAFTTIFGIEVRIQGSIRGLRIKNLLDLAAATI